MRNLALSLLSVLALLGLVSCTRTGGGPCDPKALGELKAALPAVDADMRQALALRGLGEACAARLPKPIAEALQADAEPSQEATLAAYALSQEPGFGEAACPGFEKLFASVASVAPADRPRVLYGGCGYSKLGLVSLEEYQAAAQRRAGASYLAPGLYAWLVEEGMPAPEARALVRAALGVDR
ncbi:MAG TPA: hypothetical protein PK668_07280 [Myxococcota bacterium]|nr:hypothetical protein [Myxococcota bacterium]HRY92353.1 hypothetical protein [Myxococcota bacterium]HSA24399.1 hypothetical protein [Myxococcota bacterium]